MEKVKNQNKANEFWDKYGVKILISIGGVTLIVLGAFGVKKHLDNTRFERYLNRASLSELKATRDVVHKEFLNPSDDIEYRGKIGDYILPAIDKRISKLEWGDKAPTPPSYHREHGFNLYKPD